MVPPPELAPPSGVFIPPAPGASAAGGGAPVAVMWLRVFSAFQLLLAGVMLLGGVALVVFLSVSPPPSTPGELPAWIVPLFLIVLSAPVAAIHLVGVVAPRRKWMFAYGLVLACLSFVCGGCWPLGVVALVFWFKPETKVWFDTGPG